MNFKVLSAKGVLLPPTVIDPPDHLISKKGSLVICATGPEDFVDSLEGITNHISKEYFESPDSVGPFFRRKPLSPLLILKKAVEKSSVPQSCSVLVLSVQKQYLYIAAFGESSVWLERSGSKTRVYVNTRPQVLCASGVLHVGDAISVGFSELMPKEDAEDIFRAEVVDQDHLILQEDTDSKADRPPAVEPTQEEPLTQQTAPQHEEEQPIQPDYEKPEDAASDSSAYTPAVTSPDETSTIAPKTSLKSRLGLDKEVPLSDLKRLSRKHIIGIVLIFLAIVLGVSVYYSIYQRQEEQKSKDFNQLVSGAELKLSEAVSLKNLNSDRSLRLVKEAEENIFDAKRLDIQPERISTIEKKIASVKESLQKRVDASFEPFVQLNAPIVDMVLDADSVYVLLDSGQVKQIKITDKKQIDWGIVPHGKALRLIGAAAYVLTPTGVSKVEAKSVTAVIEKNEKWQDVVDLYPYNNNLYLLDSGAKSVWKYVPGGGGFVFGGNSIDDKAKNEIRNPSSLAVDGNIWVTDTTTVFKFLVGKKEDFKLRGFDGKFGSPTRMFTLKEEREPLYILDKSNARIIQIGKNGHYQSQYTGDEISKATGIGYNPSEKKLYASVGNQIVRFTTE